MKRALTSALARSLRRLAPRARVAAALGRHVLPRTAATSVTVIAIGKAAPAMAAGALDAWGDRIARILVVTTDGTAAALPRARRLEVLRSAHPVPDARSVRAAARCLALAREAEVLLVLVSGGASALVCAPPAGVTLATKRALTRTLLASGATIQELNTVRKHLSQIKGGGLGRAAAGPVLTLVVSDVIGGLASDVGSGPSVGDDTSVAEARVLLRRYAPARARLPLVRTGRVPNDAGARVLVSPEELARIVAAELRQTGYRVRVLPPSSAPVESLAREYARLAKSLRPGSAVVRAAEPAVTLPGGARGQGGRSTHLAALVAASLPRGVTFMAAATDGVDGSSRTAGAIVDARFSRRVGEAELARALARFDTGRLHRRARTALPLRPSGQNLTDLHVLVCRA